MLIIYSSRKGGCLLIITDILSSTMLNLPISKLSFCFISVDRIVFLKNFYDLGSLLEDLVVWLNEAL